MLKYIFFFLLIATDGNMIYGQGGFSYLGKTHQLPALQKLDDSLRTPLLIYGDKVYAISCASRMLDGDNNDRDDDGNNMDRDDDGNSNKRSTAGAIGDRKKKGKAKDRNKEGKTKNRKKAGKKNKRQGEGDENDREDDGDANTRSSDGSLREGTRCSSSKKGKLLLYTREKMKQSDTKLLYKGKYFTNHYYKIIQL